MGGLFHRVALVIKILDLSKKKVSPISQMHGCLEGMIVRVARQNSIMCGSIAVEARHNIN